MKLGFKAVREKRGLMVECLGGERVGVIENCKKSNRGKSRVASLGDMVTRRGFRAHSFGLGIQGEVHRF